jgi:regulator of sigma E protease
MANFAFAVVAYLLVLVLGVEGLRPVIGDVGQDTPAAAAGFRVGDEIVRIDGRANQTWSEHRMYLFYRALRGADVEFEVRGEEGASRTLRLDLSTVPPASIDAGLIERVIGLSPRLPEPPAEVGTVLAGTPADRAGLEVGDYIVRIGPYTVANWRHLVEIVSERPGESMEVVIDRGGQLVTVSMTPDTHLAGDREVGRIGIAPAPMELPEGFLVEARYGPGALLTRSLETTWVTTALTVTMLYKMAKLEVSSRNISGPITIAHYAGTTARIGLDQFLLFLAVVSISLGIINLLPIPMLDGGHLLYYAAEAVKGSPVSEQTMIRGQQVGILMLIGLMGLAFYNDIVRLLQ